MSASHLEIFDRYVNKIAAEVVVAQEGADNVLVPIYSLFGEWYDAWPYADSTKRIVQQVQNVLGELLNHEIEFDKTTLNYVQHFLDWAERNRSAVEFGAEPTPLEQYTNFPIQTHKINVDTPTEASPATPADNADILAIDVANNADLLGEFCTEANEHLDVIEACVLELEHNPQHTESISSIFRAFHTIKGIAGFMHLDPVQKLAHEVESMFDKVRHSQLIFNSDVASIALSSRDKLKELVKIVTAALRGGPQSVAVTLGDLLQKIERVIQGKPLANAQTEAPKTTEIAPSTGAPSATNTPAKNNIASIRVDTEKLDDLLNRIGELVIAQTQIEDSAKAECQRNIILQRNLAQLFRITKELQHTSMSLRMTPIKATFQKLSRQVREVSKALNKEVELHLSGEETEVDRNVIEKIGDPLIHMIRNAVDHGLESPEERTKLGKTAQGNIYLRAYHSGNYITIEIQDDGKGINCEAVIQKAKEKNLIPKDATPSTKEAYQFLFLPGFSTATQVTEVSGRGVGMDVVKRNIEELHGTIDIDSTPHKGTTFRIKLPLTTAIIDGLIVKVGKERFILPTISVRVVMKPESGQIATIGGNREVLNRQNETIPIVRLHRRLNIDDAITNLCDGIVVVIENNGNPYGLFVDAMLNKQEVVIKSLGELGLCEIAGGAVLGDGTSALIIDPSALCFAEN